MCVCFNTVHSTLGKSPDDQTLSLFTHTEHCLSNSLKVRLKVEMQHTAVLSERAHPSHRQLKLNACVCMCV